MSGETTLQAHTGGSGIPSLCACGQKTRKRLQSCRLKCQKKHYQCTALYCSARHFMQWTNKPYLKRSVVPAIRTQPHGRICACAVPVVYHPPAHHTLNYIYQLLEPLPTVRAQKRQGRAGTMGHCVNRSSKLAADAQDNSIVVWLRWFRDNRSW